MKIAFRTDGSNAIGMGHVINSLSLPERESFKETIKILQEQKTYCLVTDLLEIHDDYSTELKKNKILCVSIDILGKIKLKSDIIINRTTISKRFEQYDRNQPTKYFFGPQYVPLRTQFIGMDKVPPQQQQKV